MERDPVSPGPGVAAGPGAGSARRNSGWNTQVDASEAEKPRDWSRQNAENHVWRKIDG